MKPILTTALAGATLIALGACSSRSDNTANTTDTATMMNDSAAADANGAAPMTPDPSGDAQRLRGTAASVSSTALALKGYDGQNATVSLGDQTKYAWVEKASLSDVKEGDFIGTATTGQGADMRAVEVVIFPDSMRGAGEGHYPWSMPAVLQQQGNGQGASAMTNGTVQNSAMTNGTVQNSAMTNGTVQNSAMTNGTVQNAGNGAGGTTLTVGYKGHSAQIIVPPGTPIVRFVPTDKGSLATGQKLFVVASPASGGGSPSAQFVAMGRDGVTPPM